MRTKFVECRYYYQAYRLCPWASKAMKVCGGYMMFESVDDYRIAKMQK